MTSDATGTGATTAGPTGERPSGDEWLTEIFDEVGFVDVFVCVII